MDIDRPLAGLYVYPGGVKIENETNEKMALT